MLNVVNMYYSNQSAEHGLSLACEFDFEHGTTVFADPQMSNVSPRGPSWRRWAAPCSSHRRHHHHFPQPLAVTAFPRWNSSRMVWFFVLIRLLKCNCSIKLGLSAVNDQRSFTGKWPRNFTTVLKNGKIKRPFFQNIGYFFRILAFLEFWQFFRIFAIF